MPIIKLIFAICISILPLNPMRTLGYRLLGYRITKSKIGFGTFILVDNFSASQSKIGWFNLFIGPMNVVIDKNVSIGHQNKFICGYWVLQEQYKKFNYTRTLQIEESALITSNHYFDVVGTFILGERSWIAGIESQFWTHGAGTQNRTIKIGNDCYIGSAVRFAPNTSIANNSLVALGSVVSNSFQNENVLIGGAPARVLKENYNWKTDVE
jgi:acetyltransferase-like isoleucine patch superfamily enzyme